MSEEGIVEKISKSVKVPMEIHSAALRRSSRLHLDGFASYVNWLIRRDLEQNAPDLLDYAFTPMTPTALAPLPSPHPQRENAA